MHQVLTVTLFFIIFGSSLSDPARMLLAILPNMPLLLECLFPAFFKEKKQVCVDQCGVTLTTDNIACYLYVTVTLRNISMSSDSQNSQFQSPESRAWKVVLSDVPKPLPLSSGLDRIFQGSRHLKKKKSFFRCFFWVTILCYCIMVYAIPYATILQYGLWFITQSIRAWRRELGHSGWRPSLLRVTAIGSGIRD